ncbi:MAG: hypothetical protein ACRCX7_11320 [Cetobacterium sp.]|uniref:hypothetical protein n=1 Tax=Cetobacterium sp. TaxID=2071632 RepID=UPI003F354F8D
MVATEDKLYAEYREKVLAWVEEQAKNPEVTEISFDLASCDIGVEMSDTNGWQLDWWSDDIVEFGGRKWEVEGCAYYGTVTLSIPEDEGDDENEEI